MATFNQNPAGQVYAAQSPGTLTLTSVQDATVTPNLTPVLTLAVNAVVIDATLLGNRVRQPQWRRVNSRSSRPWGA